MNVQIVDGHYHITPQHYDDLRFLVRNGFHLEDGIFVHEVTSDLTALLKSEVTQAPSLREQFQSLGLLLQMASIAFRGGTLEDTAERLFQAEALSARIQTECLRSQAYRALLSEDYQTLEEQLKQLKGQLMITLSSDRRDTFPAGRPSHISVTPVSSEVRKGKV